MRRVESGIGNRLIHIGHGGAQRKLSLDRIEVELHIGIAILQVLHSGDAHSAILGAHINPGIAEHEISGEPRLIELDKALPEIIADRLDLDQARQSEIQALALNANLIGKRSRRG